MTTITVKDIVTQYLKEHGYDGLCNSDGEGCYCQLDDFCPCEDVNYSWVLRCVPGYKVPDPDGEAGWIIEEAGGQGGAAHPSENPSSEETP
jgi:hypothetical protein